MLIQEIFLTIFFLTPPIANREIILDTGMAFRLGGYNVNINDNYDIIVSTFKEVYHFDKNGHLIRTIKSPSESGEGPGGFLWPRFTCFDGDHYYMYSAMTAKLLIFDKDGKNLLKFPQFAMNMDLINNELYVRSNGLMDHNYYRVYSLNDLQNASKVNPPKPKRTFWPISDLRKELNGPVGFVEGSIIPCPAPMPRVSYLLSEIIYPRIYFLDKNYEIVRTLDLDLPDFKPLEKLNWHNLPKNWDRKYSGFLRIMSYKTGIVCYFLNQERVNSTEFKLHKFLQAFDLEGKPLSKRIVLPEECSVCCNSNNIFYVYEKSENELGLPIYAVKTIF